MNNKPESFDHPHHSSRSPLTESLRNFTKNQLAMFGFIVVVVMVILVVFAPWICQQNPTELRPWIRAQPPGAEFPDCQAESTFTIGQTAESTLKLSGAQRVKISVETVDTNEIRVVLKRGMIHRITQVAGAISLDELDIGAEAEEVREILDNGTVSNPLLKIKLRVGTPPPPGFISPGQRVVFLQLINGTTYVEYIIKLKNAVVTSIQQDGQPVNHIVVRGETIQQIVADGKILKKRYILGTDELGRDLLGRILYGGRISLLIGITATLVSLLIGVCYGSISAYFGGKVDRVMMGLVDILYGIPFMFLVIILLVLFGRNIMILFVALGAVQWLTMARIIRGQILSLKQMEFVAAARVCGAGPLRILFKHLIPNAIGPMVIYATLMVPVVILEESFLAFIGLTVQFNGENLDSWGALVYQGMQAMGNSGTKSWLLIWPSLAMALTLFGLNIIGDGLRDSFDPKTRKVA